MSEIRTLRLAKEQFKFSSGHFTIFSETERECLHGHDFRVAVVFECVVGELGMAFDYNDVKVVIQAICDDLDELVLLPGRCLFLEISEEAGSVECVFGNDRFQFPANDVCVLPLTNITLETLSGWFRDQLFERFFSGREADVTRFAVTISAGEGQSAKAEMLLG